MELNYKIHHTLYPQGRNIILWNCIDNMKLCCQLRVQYNEEIYYVHQTRIQYKYETTAFVPSW